MEGDVSKQSDRATKYSFSCSTSEVNDGWDWPELTLTYHRPKH